MTMQFGSATEFSNKCGVTLMNTPIGRVVADVMGAKDGVELTEYPSMIRVDGERLLDFDYDELTDALGEDFDGSIFEEISSTHYGRMVHLDDKTLLFASPEDAAEYIGFDLTAKYRPVPRNSPTRTRTTRCIRKTERLLHRRCAPAHVGRLAMRIRRTFTAHNSSTASTTITATSPPRNSSGTTTLQEVL